jgi:hypothetical protein
LRQLLFEWFARAVSEGIRCLPVFARRVTG